jgi:hypothetical protein
MHPSRSTGLNVSTMPLLGTKCQPSWPNTWFTELFQLLITRLSPDSFIHHKPICSWIFQENSKHEDFKPKFCTYLLFPQPLSQTLLKWSFLFNHIKILDEYKLRGSLLYNLLVCLVSPLLRPKHSPQRLLLRRPQYLWVSYVTSITFKQNKKIIFFNLGFLDHP